MTAPAEAPRRPGLPGTQQSLSPTVPATGSPDPSLRQSLPLLALGGVVLVFASVGLRGLSDPDLGWHLRTGQLILDSGFVGHDPWSFASSQPWVHHEWGGEVLMYLAYAGAGYQGVIVLRLVLMLTLGVLVARACLRVAGPLATTIAMALSALSLWSRATERPQLISLCILAAVLPAFLRAAQERRPPWWLVPVSLVWVNVHALWVVIPVLLVVLMVGMSLDDRRSSRRWLGPWSTCLGCVLLVAMANPAGAHIFGIFDVGGAGFIGEFGPPQLTDPTNITAALLAAIVVTAWARSESAVPWTVLSFALVLIGIGFLYSRNVPIAAIGLAPLAATAMSGSVPLGRPFKVPDRDKWGLAALGIAFAVVAAVQLGGSSGFGTPGLGPARRLDALDGRAHVLNEYNDGGWLVWTARDTSVAIDGRAEVYGSAYVTKYLDARAMRPGWRRYVASGDFAAAYLYRSTPLVQGLRTDGWRTVWRHDHHVLMLPPRTSTAP